MADELAKLIAEMKEEPLKKLTAKREEGSQEVNNDGHTKRKPEGDLSISLKKKKAKKSSHPSIATASHTQVDRFLEIESKPVGDKSIWNPFLVLTKEQDEELLRWSEVGRQEEVQEEAHDGEVWRLAVEEAMRWRAMSRLANTFHDMCGNALGAKWTRHFEKWLYSRRAVCTTCPAGVFPLGKGVERDEELERKLCASGMTGGQAERCCEALGSAAKKAAHSIGRVAIAAGKKNARVKVQRICMKEGDREREKVVLACSGVRMEINADHLVKLQALAARVPHGRLRSARAGVQDAGVFALLARYASFQGGHYKAGGFQAAIHGECFDVLQQEFGCWMECFASPMNCRYARFCSAHPATDAPFGSLGSFFHFHPRYGSFEANPPFDDGTIQRMLAHMEALIRATALPLSFVIIVPYLPAQAAWSALNASRFNQKLLHLPQAEHGYFEGSQHDRINRYRVAPFDTSIFFLRNAAAQERWPLTKERLARLQNAFRPKLHLNPHGLQFAPDADGDDDDDKADPPVSPCQPASTLPVPPSKRRRFAQTKQPKGHALPGGEPRVQTEKKSGRSQGSAKNRGGAGPQSV